MRAAWRWRARQAALKAGQGAASGLVASAAHGNEVRPRSAARQGTAGPFGRHGGEAARRRALVAACASTGWAPAARGQAAGSERGQAAAQRGSEAAAAAQRGSERTRAQVPARARRAEREGQRGRERGERKRVERERNCQRLDLIQTQNFQLKLENF